MAFISFNTLDPYARDAYNINVEGGSKMKFTEVERMLMEDGWLLKNIRGSHYHYIHPNKPGKVTIPRHGGDIDSRTLKSIKRQAGIK